VLKPKSEPGAPLEDILIGDIRLARSSFGEYPEGSEERAQAQKRNDALLAGDENIEWSYEGTKKEIERIRQILAALTDTNCRLSCFRPPW
jgi:hypothetical protein